MKKNGIDEKTKDEVYQDNEKKSEVLWVKGVRKELDDPVEASGELCRLGIPVYILYAGRDWEWFDYEPGLEKLTRIMKRNQKCYG